MSLPVGRGKLRRGPNKKQNQKTVQVLKVKPGEGDDHLFGNKTGREASRVTLSDKRHKGEQSLRLLLMWQGTWRGVTPTTILKRHEEEWFWQSPSGTGSRIARRDGARLQQEYKGNLHLACCDVGWSSEGNYYCWVQVSQEPLGKDPKSKWDKTIEQKQEGWPTDDLKTRHVHTLEMISLIETRCG